MDSPPLLPFGLDFWDSFLPRAEAFLTVVRNALPDADFWETFTTALEHDRLSMWLIALNVRAGRAGCPRFTLHDWNRLVDWFVTIPGCSWEEISFALLWRALSD